MRKLHSKSSFSGPACGAWLLCAPFIPSIIIISLCVSQTNAESPSTAPTTQPVSIPTAIDRGIKFLEKFQSPDGSWGTGRETRGTEIYSMVPGSLDSFRIGASALCVMALREAGEKAAHDKGLEFLLHAPDVKRDDGALLYNTWSHIYMVQAMSEEILHGNKDPRLAEVAKRNLKQMVEYATYMGGWAYYDFDAHTQTPSMGPTCFGTAAGLVALFEARQAGIEIPEKLVTQATHQLEKMRLPNGVFLYGADYLYHPTLPANLPRGAFGRTQPANYALWLWKSKEVNAERINASLDLFFKDHKFLDMGRKRPWPHESWYQTSGYYYYFDHYYASRLLESLDAGKAKTDDAKQIAAHVLPHQEEDGSWWDYAMWDFHKPYGTAFAIMTLLRCEPRVFDVGPDVKRVVFLCDESGSMLNKMATLRDELNRTVAGMNSDQSFNVILAANHKPEALDVSFLKVNRDSKLKLADFIEGITGTGVPEFAPAFQMALKLKPDAIYFLTDAADFPDTRDIVSAIKTLNADHKIRLNTILFVEDAVERKKNAESEPLMKQIAGENGGTFKWVEMDSLQR